MKDNYKLNNGMMSDSCNGVGQLQYLTVKMLLGSKNAISRFTQRHNRS